MKVFLLLGLTFFIFLVDSSSQIVKIFGKSLISEDIRSSRSKIFTLFMVHLQFPYQFDKHSILLRNLYHHISYTDNSLSPN